MNFKRAAAPIQQAKRQNLPIFVLAEMPQADEPLFRREKPPAAPTGPAPQQRL